ncbi:glutamate receptor ionotropic, kainate 2-like isoform X1 [Daktulosphaira vitifoliae]|uniref:glutamate receptor ionotropic, kainate 2-like isoform X1 n=1 Tax=Daktulosphaira vitifoliae TaxID=58002 RepID=UPI0021A9AC07|nr:glutamate receptor ionotropic, kainate 2-like isoform X1 [Daktulosphaira vitifoliae]
MIVFYALLSLSLIMISIGQIELTALINNESPVVHKNTVKTVAVFHENEDPTNRLAYIVSAKTINIMDTILPRTNILPTSQHVMYDMYNVTQAVCDSMSFGIASFIGGTYEENTENVIRSISSRAQIPFIETHWKTSPRPPDAFTISLFPEPLLLAKAIKDIIEDMDWSSFTIIYDRPEKLIQLKALLESNEYGRTSSSNAIKVKQMKSTEDFRPLFKELKEFGEKHIVLDIDDDFIISVLKQAKEVEFMGDYQSYVITNMDAHTLNFEDFRHVKSNITLIRMIDPENPLVTNAVNEMIFNEQRKGRSIALTPQTIKTQTALIYDAVHFFATSLHGLVSTQSMKSQQIFCKDMKPWIYGFSLIHYMRVIELEGLTGKMRFDNITGNRIYFKLDVIKINDLGFQHLGSWDPDQGMSYTRSASEVYSEFAQSISNKTFVVVGKIGDPYLMRCNGTKMNELDVSDECFHGFAYELIAEIAIYNKFKFKFVPNPELGKLQSSGKWNGIIGDLQSMKADLAICDLTINFDRRSVVDFTTPFMTLGISILYAKPDKKKPQLFWFLNPLSFNVWIYTATAYLGVSLILFILARITPNEWHNPQPWKNGNGELETKLNVANLIWFSCGTMLQQGSDISPQAVSTRLVASMWWFFALIMTSSYTANLAASITSGRLDTPIKNVDDLSKDPDIEYGCFKDGSTARFFQTSNVSLYQRMWSVMESSDPSVFTNGNQEGVDRVLKGKGRYAFLMESATIEYQTERHCNLMQVGNTLDSKGYGIAMPINSPYRTLISESVLRLQELGFLRDLKDKWWLVKGDKKCEEEVESDELGFAKIGGVFVVLIFGCLIAFLFSILEFLWNIRKVALEEQLTPKEAFILEWKFAIKCNGVVKPLRRRHALSKYDITNADGYINNKS